MSDQKSTGADLYSRPTEIDAGAYLRIRQIRPVERAVSPVVDHNIELTETALGVRSWYRGETHVDPSAYMSMLLDPDRNNAVAALSGFAATVKAFSPGAFPAHCHAVRELEFTTKHLVATLSTLVDAAAFAHSLRCLGAFFAAISDPANIALSEHDYVQRVDAKLAALIDSFRQISREFAMREREIVFRFMMPMAAPCRRSPTRKSISVSMAAKLTGLSESTIKRLDRDPKNTNYPGRNATAKMLAAWARLYKGDKLAAGEVRAANRPALGR